jgi:hypothetical protein
MGAIVARVPLTQVVARASLLALALAALGAGSASAQACTKTWASSDGSWTSAADWSPAGVPGPNDDVCLTGAGSYTLRVPAIAGGAQARSLTVGDAAGGAKVLEIDGESVPNGGVTQQDTRLTVADGGTISPNGSIVLNATDDGTTRTPGEIPGGSATLAGDTFTNEGTILARSSSPRMQKDYLRAGIVNTAGGTVDVTSGLLWYDSGATFQNNGTVRAVGTGNLVFTTDPNLSATPTRMVNAGSVLTSGGVEVERAGWTQAGGSVTGDNVYISNGALDYQSGTGSFVLSEPLGGTATSTLSGTIPQGSGVIIRGGTFGTAESRPWTVQLTGAEVVNRGVLMLDAFADTATGQGGPATVQGAPLRNYGTIRVLAENSPGFSAYPDYVRTNVTNEPGGEIDVSGSVVQDSGSSLVNHGTFTILDGRYALSAGPLSTATSTFTNAPDGAIGFNISSLAPPTFEIGPGGAFFAGGALLPATVGIFKVAQGGELRLFPITGGAVGGRFARVEYGFGADYSHGDFIGVLYGTVVRRVSPGRGSLSVTLSCPAGRTACPKAIVSATAKERVRVASGTGSHRRTRIRVRTVLVGTTSGAIAAGSTRTLVLTLNRAGRRLLAHAPGTLGVRVVVASSGGTKIATRGVRVLRL